MDDYSAFPRTINEPRSDRTGAAKDWTPRDLLISALREIDNNQGAVSKATKAILIIGHFDEDGSTQIQLCRAGTTNAWESLGMLTEGASVITGNR